MTTAATARPAWSAASIPPGSTWRWATWSRGAEAARFRYPRRAGWATAARFSHRRSRLLPGGRQHHVRHPGERLCEDPRRARLVAGNRRRAAPPSGDPGHGGGGLPQRREQRGGARCPVSDPRRYPCRCPRSAPSPPAICPVPIFRHALSMPRRCRCPPTAKPTAIASVPT